jgi:hypothetical protein
MARWQDEGSGSRPIGHLCVPSRGRVGGGTPDWCMANGEFAGKVVLSLGLGEEEAMLLGAEKSIEDIADRSVMAFSHRSDCPHSKLQSR